MDAENRLDGCQLEQCADIYLGAYLSQRCLNQAFPGQDQHNVVHIEQDLPQQVTSKCYSI